jgi:hypothetical protein
MDAAAEPAPPRTRVELLGLVGLVTLAIAVRTLAWLRATAMMNDGPTFIGIAEQFAAGDVTEALAHAFHPLYPLAIALVKPLFAAWDDAAACVSILSGGLAVFALYGFLRRAFDPTVAWVGALLLAVHPYAVPFSADVQSEGLYIALFLAAVAATWRALVTRRVIVAVGAGVLGGFAYLVRPEGIGVTLVGLTLIGIGVTRRDWSLAAAARVAAALALGAGLLMGPYLAAVARDEGQLTLTRKKSISAIARFETRDDDPAPGSAEPVEIVGAGRAQLALDTAAAIADPARHGFRPDHWILLGLGLFAARGRPGARAIYLGTIVLLYAFVLTGLQLSSGYVSMRHVLPPLLPCLGYVALGIPVAGRVLLAGPARLAGRRPSPGAALALGLALVVVASGLMAVRPRREARAAVRAAAGWLQLHAPEKQIVASSKLRDAYYAGAPGWLRLPDPGPEEAWVRGLRAQGVRFVVLDGRDLDRYPALAPGAPYAELVHRSDVGGRWAGVWELRPDAAAGEGR